MRAPDGAATYAELDQLADDLAHGLRERGVVPGDRVALWLDKGLQAVAVMQATLRCGAAYVPIDSKSPPARVQLILDECRPKVVVTKARNLSRVKLRGATAMLMDMGIDRFARPFVMEEERGTDELAYILFTSGSTGIPKGVCISHRNALAFVEWSAKAIGAVAEDHFANHAPFHFDLSVFDLYVSFLVGARVCIAGELLSLAADRLVDFMREEQISVWYSVPSALIMMMDGGRLLADQD
ncbi:MAG: AMP-binding protein, partial [Myxococcales bacterium]|nr:AMP-binding protein [Myxococcales bacterium]